ncbi:response regulator [Varunaivibrio sulfuroxidans]|uniref:Response regulator receiver domain-containing protein n=1 Tax=Varunaivibrio sulfuroxidans TaxID=1773489 RepID=A0A4R3J5W2_9PROT|nr:response regulator [Varunaivibrio sulfuroxidans]TCS61228.1 response regulator receiver domain-containing protein [Varunaivibrio sulfuroxidans]WES31151.1 response regulator [Varunaivibrio sulfuroxidans]
MKRFNFEQVHLLLIDQDSVIRQTLRNILTDNGFRNIRLGADLFDLKSSFKTLEPDLLICDMDIGECGLAPFIHKLRHHDIPANPFIPVIATSWSPTPSAVRQIINAGADDLLTKPLSASQILSRIKSLVLARKPFIVTHEYIGPERRKPDAAREATIPQFPVPNVLRAKALAQGRIDPSSIQQAIDEAVATVNFLKLERDAFQVLYLVDRIVPALAMFGEADEATKMMIDRLIYLAEDMVRRINRTKYAHVAELCESLMSVTTNLRDSQGCPSLKDVNLLKPLAQSIHAGFAQKDVEAAQIAHKISSTVKR